MSDQIKTPWHLWVVGAITFFWNFAGGGLDYIFTQLNAEFYMSGYTDAQRAYYEALPAWFDAVWAISIWSSVLGSILILLKNKLAFPVFAVSIVGYIFGTIYSFAISNVPDVTTANYIFTGVITAVLLFEVWYSSMMKKRGVLR